MTNDRITQLYAKKLSGEATEEELQELAAHLSNNPDEQYFQEILGNWWESKDAGAIAMDADQEDHFKFIMRQASDNSLENITAPVVKINSYKIWKRLAVAAVAACILSFGAWKFLAGNKAEQLSSSQENEIIAKRGTKSKLLLPDGTQVWLNSESKLTYNNAFNGTLREVTLEGEAYFDVVKNPKRPFIVHTSGISIKVLGTAFNVKSYPMDPTIEATLVRGLIEVEKNNQPLSPKILLHPNEKLVYNKIQDKSVTSDANKEKGNALTDSSNTITAQSISISTLPKNTIDSTRIETSWVYGRLLFEGDTFRELAPKMERWFNVKISFKNSKVANYRFRGVFENENIEEALQALQLTAAFKYTLNGNEVIVDKK